jgi:hypothetical protein
MKLLARLICRLLIASMLFLPFSANAGMVSTDEAVMSARDLARRDTVRDFITREDVANELRAMGVSPSAAQARVAAMTQEEVNQLAGHIDAMPAAGSMAHAVVIALVIALVAVIIYFIWKDREAAK